MYDVRLPFFVFLVLVLLSLTGLCFLVYALASALKRPAPKAGSVHRVRWVPADAYDTRERWHCACGASGLTVTEMDQHLDAVKHTIYANARLRAMSHVIDWFSTGTMTAVPQQYWKCTCEVSGIFPSTAQAHVDAVNETMNLNERFLNMYPWGGDD